MSSASGGVARPNRSAMARVWNAWTVASPGLQYGLRIWVSVCLALGVAYWLELNDPWWAATSAAIVCQPSLGTSLRKGWFRAIGTLVGAAMIVVLTASFPQSRYGLLIGLTLWASLCGFFATILRNFASYSAALAGYTAAIVFADTINAPTEAFDFAVTRATEICIGIVAAGLVLMVTDFGDARRRLAQAFSDVAQGITAGLAETLTVGRDTIAIRDKRRELIRRVIALDATIDEALGEASELRTRSLGLQAAVEGLFMALSAWRGIGNHLHIMTEAERQAVSHGILLSAVNSIGGDWLDDAEAVREMCGVAADRVQASPASDLSMRMLVDGVSDALRSLQRAANGLVLLTALGHEWRERGHKHLHVPDVLPGLINALRTFAALTIAELAWIWGNWSGGESMITFTAVGVILFSARADDAYPAAAGYAVGTVVAVALAAIVNFAVLPAQQSFIGLSLVLSCVLVPFGALSIGSWQKPAFMAIVTLLLPLLAPANQPVYDPGQFFNAALAIVAGTIVAAASLRLFPPLSAETRSRRLRLLTLRDLGRLAVRRRWLDRSGWVGAISGRLAAMPPQATREEAAELLAALSAGEVVIQLRTLRDGLARTDLLDGALACLAAGDIEGLRDRLSRFGAEQVTEGPGATDGIHASAAAARMLEILNRHGGFLARATEAI